MTFANFETLFKSKYPNGTVHMHGEFGGTEKNKKVTVVFSGHGRCYDYSGAYEDILCKIGVLTISKERMSSLEKRLADLRERNGTENFFGGVCDYSGEIASLSEKIESIKKNYIIV